jgi:hypothetical protein
MLVVTGVVFFTSARPGLWTVDGRGVCRGMLAVPLVAEMVRMGVAVVVRVQEST